MGGTPLDALGNAARELGAFFCRFKQASLAELSAETGSVTLSPTESCWRKVLSVSVAVSVRARRALPFCARQARTETHCRELCLNIVQLSFANFFFVS